MKVNLNPMPKLTAKDFIENVLDQYPNPSIQEAAKYTLSEGGTDEDMYQVMISALICVIVAMVGAVKRVSEN